MRIMLLVLWLLIPLGALAFHYGPGQDLAKKDLVAHQLRLADQFRLSGDLIRAQEALEKGMELLPVGDVKTRRKIRLELCKVQLENHALPIAAAELESLMEELTADAGADPAIVDDCRSTLANSQFYLTWLMRMEGLNEDEWGPTINAAQQNYRLLSERAVSEGNAQVASRHREDLESAVRLARMDLGELRGLPLPNQ